MKTDESIIIHENIKEFENFLDHPIFRTSQTSGHYKSSVRWCDIKRPNNNEINTSF